MRHLMNQTVLSKFVALFVPCAFMLMTTMPVVSQQQAADLGFDTKVARPAYTKKHPKILFDEAHNNFHTAGGRYRPFADLMMNDGCAITPNKSKFERRTLEGYDVLVIANALGAAIPVMAEAGKPAFTDAECDAVREWVRAGGSLLLISDHAPTGAAAKNMAERFGVDMSTGVTGDAVYYDKEIDNPGWLIFTRENGLLLDHPITRGRNARERINRIETFTGQSLKGPEGSAAFLKLSDKAFDIHPPSQDETSAAGRAQAVAFKFGKGRVVVLGEAAMLSAQVEGNVRFGMNRPGYDNRQLALNIMHWLTGLL